MAEADYRKDLEDNVESFLQEMAQLRTALVAATGMSLPRQQKMACQQIYSGKDDPLIWIEIT